MLHMFKTGDAGIEPVDAIVPGCWIDLVAPTEAELEFVSESDRHPGRHPAATAGPRREVPHRRRRRPDAGDRRHPGHREERRRPRVGHHPARRAAAPGATSSPSACRSIPSWAAFERGTIKGFSTVKQTRFLLQILREVAAFYLRYLSQIDRETDKLERRLRASQENKELYELLTLAKSLVYFTTSLRSNAAVLKRLHAHAERAHVRGGRGTAGGRAGRDPAGHRDVRDLLQHPLEHDGRLRLGHLEQPQPGDEVPDLGHHPGVGAGGGRRVLRHERQAAAHRATCTRSRSWSVSRWWRWRSARCCSGARSTSRTGG